MLHFPVTEMCLFVFSFEFLPLDIPQLKFKKKNSVPYSIIYGPDHLELTSILKITGKISLPSFLLVI